MDPVSGAVVFMMVLVSVGLASLVLPVRVWTSRAGRALRRGDELRALGPVPETLELPTGRIALISGCELAAFELTAAVEAGLDFAAVAESSRMGRWLTSMNGSDSPATEHLQAYLEAQSRVAHALVDVRDRLDALTIDDDAEARHFVDGRSQLMALHRDYLRVEDDVSFLAPTRVQVRKQVEQLRRLRRVVVDVAQRAQEMGASPYRGA